MSDSAATSLTEERIQELLAAVGSEPDGNGEQPEADDYDWRKPRYFSTEQQRKIDAFAKDMAAAAAERFTALYGSTYCVAVSSICQCFAGQFNDQPEDSQEDSYYLPFGIDGEPACGAVRIPLETATEWVTLMLGDSESQQDSAGGLSQLEESLLADAASALVTALFDTHDSCNFQPGGRVFKGQMPVEFDDAEELCEIALDTSKGETESGNRADIRIACSRLNTIAGKTNSDKEVPADNDISQMITDHLMGISVPVTVRLATTTLDFEQIMTLKEGDVVLLDKNVREDSDLLVRGQRLFRGQLAKVSDNKALVITEDVIK